MHSVNHFYNFFDFSNNLSFSFFSFFSSAEFFSIIFIFNFMQLLIMSVISELIWPTQLFNRQHTIGFNAYRLRTYTETICKLKKYSIIYKVLNKTLFKHK